MYITMLSKVITAIKFIILDYETVQFHDYNVLQEPATST